MSRSSAWIALLTIALVASNAWWAVQTRAGQKVASHDRLTSVSESLELSDRAVVQAFSAIQATALPGATKSSVISAVSKATRYDQRICFGDEGVVEVGVIGLKFDKNERLVGATRMYCPP